MRVSFLLRDVGMSHLNFLSVDSLDALRQRMLLFTTGEVFGRSWSHPADRRRILRALDGMFVVVDGPLPNVADRLRLRLLAPTMSTCASSMPIQLRLPSVVAVIRSWFGCHPADARFMATVNEVTSSTQ